MKRYTGILVALNMFTLGICEFDKTPPPAPRYSCGRENVPKEKVRGSFGYEAGMNQYPFMAALVQYKGSESKFYCGASIISQRYALSSAQCRYYNEREGWTLKLRVGDHNNKKEDETNQRATYEIEWMKQHESWSYGTRHINDIMLIKTKVFIKFGYGVGAVCLPYSGDFLYNQGEVKILGWGSNSDNRYPDVLKEIRRKATTNCHRRDDGENIADRRLCTRNYTVTGDEPYEGTCVGDIGGPLLWKNFSSNKNILLGILTVPACNNSQVDIFTRVTQYLDWILAHSQEKVCSDKECVKIAEEFLSNIDTTVNPCDNFYKFACGKYAANNPIPEDKSEVSAVTKILDSMEIQLIKALKEPIADNEARPFQMLKKYYKSCINTDRIEEIGLKVVKKILKPLGGWPVVEDTKPDIGWDSVLYGLSELGLKADYLMQMEVIADFKNSTHRILCITIPTSELGLASLRKGKSDETMQAYLDFMVQTAIAFGAKEETAKQDMELALDFEINLAIESKLSEAAVDFSAVYNLYSIEKLQAEFPGIPWADYIGNYTMNSLEIPRETEVNLMVPKYIKSLMDILKSTPTREIRNYIIWRAIWDMATYLNKEVRNLHRTFEQALSGQAMSLPRPRACLWIVIQNYLPVASALYVRKYFDQYSKTIASELVTYIKDQFERTLNETKWSEQDKAKAIEKIKSLYAHVGFPNELLDDEKLDSLYKTLEIDEDNFLQSSLNLTKFETNFKYSRLFLPINRTDWIDLAISATVNAFYKIDANSIVIPAAFLQGNYFNAKFPRYINFAGIGFVIGHEISHGFDDSGHQFNKDGAFEQWWSDVAEQDFAEKTRCLIKQYNNYTLFGEKINGIRTVGENIADFGGQKTAYLSYQNWRSRNNEEPGLPGLNYTNNQLFWIASAGIWCNNKKEEYVKFIITTDFHSPDVFRVNGPMSNLEMFAKDFNCPLGSKMNPKKKCTPW